MVIRKLFATIAPMAPGGVEFHIHHVVPAFQMNIVSKANKKKRMRFVSWSAKNNNGIHATKIRNVKAESGHANTSKRPETKLKRSGEYFFK